MQQLPQPLMFAMICNSAARFAENVTLEKIFVAQTFKLWRQLLKTRFAENVTFLHRPS
jgi:hypothetical protein